MQVIDRPTVPAWTEPTAQVADAAPRQLARLDASLEISNGNGVAGAADRLRRWLATRGVAAQRLSNQKPYVQDATVVQYRGDHGDDARRLAALLPPGVAVARSAALRTDVRVLIGRDWHRVAACLDGTGCTGAPQVQLAEAAALR